MTVPERFPGPRRLLREADPISLNRADRPAGNVAGGREIWEYIKEEALTFAIDDRSHAQRWERFF